MVKYQRARVEYETIWNGSRTGANGGYLAATPEVPVPLPPSRRSGEHGPNRRGGDLEAAVASGHFAKDDLPPLADLDWNQEEP